MIKVLINDISKAQQFVHLSESILSEVDVLSGRYKVNGKSIMGVLSLDISKPVEVDVREVVTSEKDQFESQLKNLGWVVE